MTNRSPRRKRKHGEEAPQEYHRRVLGLKPPSCRWNGQEQEPRPTHGHIRNALWKVRDGERGARRESKTRPLQESAGQCQQPLTSQSGRRGQGAFHQQSGHQGALQSPPRRGGSRQRGRNTYALRHFQALRQLTPHSLIGKCGFT